MTNRTDRRAALPDAAALEPALTEWLQSPLGSALLDAERRSLSPVLSRVFGYHVLQLSCAPDIDMLGDCLVAHKIKFAPSWSPERRQAVASIEALPLETDSIDAVLLHHALDYTRDSHRLLREATRVLRPGGRLLIVGFNPLSLWGLSRLMRWRAATPWNARFLSRRRLADWLSLLDFHIDSVSYGGFLPPLKHPRLLARAHDIERWFDRLGNPAGAFYLVVASKQRTPLIPVTPRWRKLRRPALGVPLVDTARVQPARESRVLPFRPRIEPGDSKSK